MDTHATCGVTTTFINSEWPVESIGRVENDKTINKGKLSQNITSCTKSPLRTEFLSISASFEANFDHRWIQDKAKPSESFWCRVLPKFVKNLLQKYSRCIGAKPLSDTSGGSGKRAHFDLCSQSAREVGPPAKRPWEIPFEEIDQNMNLRLGEGGQGQVSLAMYQNKLVAVKKVKTNREVDLDHLKELHHPNVVHFRGVCIRPELYCIVMEYCAYGDLYEALHVGRYVTPSNVAKWSRQIAAGMEYLHKHRIIHCDLKSPNILIGHNSNVKIIDFGGTGGSQALRRPDPNKTYAYTAAWSSPENILKGSSCYTGDVWSYGVVLWELLTCEIPYRDLHSNTIIYSVARNRIALPIPESLPKGFKHLLTQCQQYEPQRRPSFKQIIRQLETAVADLLSFSEEAFYEAQDMWNEEVGLVPDNRCPKLWLKREPDLENIRETSKSHHNPSADSQIDRYAWHYYTGIVTPTSNNSYVESNQHIGNVTSRERPSAILETKFAANSV